MLSARDIDAYVRATRLCLPSFGAKRSKRERKLGGQLAEAGMRSISIETKNQPYIFPGRACLSEDIAVFHARKKQTFAPTTRYVSKKG